LPEKYREREAKQQMKIGICADFFSAAGAKITNRETPNSKTENHLLILLNIFLLQFYFFVDSI